MHASGTYSLDSGEYQFNVQGQQLQITNLTLPDGGTVHGKLNTNLQGTGTVEQPGLDGSLERQRASVQ